MSSVEDTQIDNNKDFDKGDDEVWLDGRLQNVISNQLMDNDNKYKNQALTKFQYFRIKSPYTFFDINIGDLADEIITQLEMCIKSCETREEKIQ